MQYLFDHNYSIIKIIAKVKEICAQMPTSWSELVEGELRKILEMNRLQLPEYSNRVRCFGWFGSMASKWMTLSRNPGDDLRNDVNKIHSSVQSRLNGTPFFFRFFLSSQQDSHHIIKMNAAF